MSTYEISGGGKKGALTVEEKKLLSPDQHRFLSLLPFLQQDVITELWVWQPPEGEPPTNVCPEAWTLACLNKSHWCHARSEWESTVTIFFGKFRVEVRMCGKLSGRASALCPLDPGSTPGPGAQVSRSWCFFELDHILRGRLATPVILATENTTCWSRVRKRLQHTSKPDMCCHRSESHEHLWSLLEGISQQSI